MKLPPFNHSQQAWDLYREFYCDPLKVGGPIVSSYYMSHYASLFHQFSNGMLRINRIPKPDERRHYKDLGLRLTKADDPDCPLFQTLEGEPVKRSWLHGQYLVIDEDTGVVTRLYHHHRKNAPASMRHAVGLFIAGEPYDSQPIVITRPDKEWKAMQKDRLEGLRAACQMASKIDQTLASLVWASPRYPYPAAQLVATNSIAQLSTETILRIALHGYIWPYKDTQVPCLKLL